jgi:cysteine desulfuration protein SufE
MTIEATQNEIINEFSLLDGEMEMTLQYLMELGQKLPPLPEEYRTEENIVKGCQSKVWLNAEMKDDKIIFQADSNTAITKGLVSLLVRILSGQKPDDILNADLFFMSQIKMDRFIGTQRSNGFASMIKQMKWYALAFKTKMQTV